jgi:hypothetical protein
MSAKFEPSAPLGAALTGVDTADVLVKISAGTFARFDNIKLAILNGSLTATLYFEGITLGSYTFRRDLMDEYEIDGLFAHVKIGDWNDT